MINYHGPVILVPLRRRGDYRSRNRSDQAPDVELGTGGDAYSASLGRAAAQEGIKALMARGFHKPEDVENRLGYYLGQIAC